MNSRFSRMRPASDDLELQRTHLIEALGHCSQRRGRIGLRQLCQINACRRLLARRRQFYSTFAVYAKQRHPRAHVLEAAIRLSPVQMLAYRLGYRPSIPLRLAPGGNLANPLDLFSAEVVAAIPPAAVTHGACGRLLEEF